MTLRILHLTPGCFDKGGISRYSRHQISALREIFGPANIRVLSLLGPGPDALEEPFNVDWHGSGNSGPVGKASRMSFAARALTSAMFWQPDIIVSAHVNFGPVLTMAGRLSGAKTVLNVYGLEIWSGLSAARRAHMARTGLVIADCHFTARYVAGEGLHDREPVVIWDPVDLEKFTPGEIDPVVVDRYGLPDPQKHFIVMSLGRLAKEAAHKGYDRLIEVAAAIAPDAPDLRVVIAGRGDDRPRLEALAATRGIADRVVFTGPIDEADMAPLYRCADVFSLVSDRGHGRGEGIPLTPLEAMACGAPVIVGNDDGSQEAVSGQRNGFVISPHDRQQHREALMTLLRDRDLCRSMRIEARKVAEENFSYRSFVEKHRDLLTALPDRG